MNIIINDTKYGKVMYKSNDIAFIRELLKGKIYEQDIIESVLTNIIKNSKLVLDIGAHCGSHSIIYSRINPNIIIHAFEPQSKMYQILNMNLILNNLKNVKTYNLGLGNKRCSANMSNIVLNASKNYTYTTLSDDDLVNLGGLQIGKSGEKILMDKLDNLFFENKVDFIKMDVESFESFVIDGGLNLITKDRPIIFYENNGTDKLFENITEFTEPIEKNIDDKLKELNYEILKVDDNNNYLAIPK